MQEQELIQQNIDKYLKLVASLDPELYRIKIALEETKVNPIFIPEVIRAISNIAYGTGYGQVVIHIRDGVITHIKPEESKEMNVKAILIVE